jgi:hypothetical protein
MLLKEFFGAAINLGKKDKKDNDKTHDEHSDLFYYFLDHDKLHKDFFLPIGQRMARDHAIGKIDKKKYQEAFKPMVEKGCMEYYHKNKLKGRPAKHFPKELRDDLCERLCDHYIEAVKKNEFQLGD